MANVWVVENTAGEFVASFATRLLADFFVEDGSGCYRPRKDAYPKFDRSGQSSDMSIAIGEHAFKAGWDAAAQRAVDRHPEDLTLLVLHRERDWDEYTPPEDLCGKAF